MWSSGGGGAWKGGGIFEAEGGCRGGSVFGGGDGDGGDEKCLDAFS